MENGSAKYIWFDDIGCGHNLYGLFRKSFKINGPAGSAIISIFADTAYQLFVNGEFAGFGPVRFDPRFPLYDTYDITSRVKQGDNVIAVLVNHIGHKTFKTIPNRAGFIAWGSVNSEDGEAVSLDTYRDSWKCIRSMAHSIPSGKLSFALNDAEIYHQGLEETGWKNVDFDDGHWSGAVEIKAQNSWGELGPRNIPYMSCKNIGLPGSIRVLPLARPDRVLSFSVPTLFMEDEENRTRFSGFIAFSTWIFSRSDRTVILGNWGGDVWINGAHGLDGHMSCNKNMRADRRWTLNKGWNYYSGFVNASSGVTEHYVSFSADMGLEFAADRKHGSKLMFRHSPVVSAGDYHRYLKDKPLPYGPEEALSEIGGWIYTSVSDTAQSPCMESGWDDYRDSFEEIRAGDAEGHLFRISEYPYGFCLLIDLEQMQLAFPSVNLEGIRGASVDFVYGEQLNQDKEHVCVRSWIPLGDRVICTEDTVEWLPAHPRGARYVAMTVRRITEDVRINSLFFISANYPAEEKGRFSCSDPCLNEIWLMCGKTLAADMEDAYVDCPGRERGMYVRDTVIQYNINLAIFGDQALMRRCLELYSQSSDATGKFRAVYPNTGNYTIADFALDIVEGYRNYYENTGDTALIRKCWDAIQGNLKWFHELADEREDLLLDSEWHLKRGIEAHYGGFHGDNTVHEGLMDNTGIHCVFSCTYLIALQNALTLALTIGRNEDAAELQRRIAVLKTSIARVFWDEAVRCFADNHKLTTHSVHANIFAIRAGVVSADRLEQVKKHIGCSLKSIFVNGFGPAGGVVVSPHFAYYILDGLYKAGLYETAENMMRQGWGWMLSQGLRTCPEFFSLEFSLCHAWSASPAYYMSKNLLGVNFPEAPNLNTVEIRVNTSGVTYAEGAFPHPRGLIEVKWHTTGDGKRIFDAVKVPEGVIIRISDKNTETYNG